MKSTKIQEVLPLQNESSMAYMTLVQVDYMDGDAETYTLPLSYASGEDADVVLREYKNSILARLRMKDNGEEGILYDALVGKGFCNALLKAMARRHRRRGADGELVASTTRAFRDIRGRDDGPLEPSLLKAEQSNTSVVYGDRFILKLFRRLQPGVNPDLEVGRFLTEHRFAHIPPVAGAIEYRKGRKEPMTLAILQGLVPNEGDAWEYTLDVLGHYFENVLAQRSRLSDVPLPKASLLDLVEVQIPEEVSQLIGPYMEAARLLGLRTGELHTVLSSSPDEPAFAPESFTKLYQRSLYQSMRTLAGQVFQLLRQRLKDLPEALRLEAQQVLDLQKNVIDAFRAIPEKKITAMRIRCHGDYHLGQVLYTGKDFVIIDFEGEPARPIGERRIKRSPLRDVAGMLRSFDYAVHSAMFAQEARGLFGPEDQAYLESWAGFWHLWVCVGFLKPYLGVAAQGQFLPKTRDEIQVLLDVYLLEKAIYELGYELNNRPDWAKIPLRGIKQLLGSAD
jgi:maltose alpha-D-glucosyltransferase/alpha-amylase